MVAPPFYIVVFFHMKHGQIPTGSPLMTGSPLTGTSNAGGTMKKIVASCPVKSWRQFTDICQSEILKMLSLLIAAIVVSSVFEGCIQSPFPW